MPEPENSKKVVCIADHDEDDRMLLHEALLSLNQPCEILEISTRDQLTDQLSKLSDIFPDFIFLNTGMSGIEMVHCIETIRKETGSGMKAKIIIYSTDSDRSSIEKAFELGADFYAVKPSNYKDLKKLAGTVIEMEWETSEEESRIFHIGF
ncbi:response regulator [Flavobacterium sp.]|uniref:response regulator n=1 Tax=Flavobacterium sp. TaxID=239 RepID=UPI0031E05809